MRRPRTTNFRLTLTVSVLIAAVGLLLFTPANIRALDQNGGIAKNTIPNTPLFVSIRSGNFSTADIWTWGGSEFIQWTRNQHSYVPIVSPTGMQFVFLRQPAAYYQNRTDTGYDSPAPLDIYLMDVLTGAARPIAAQPTDTDYTPEKFKFVVRSQPSWSPDGKLLAWTEVTLTPDSSESANLQVEKLVVYDWAAKKLRTVVPELPAHRMAGNYPLLSGVAFGPDGILAVNVHGTLTEKNPIMETVYFYDTKIHDSGKEISNSGPLAKVDANYGYNQLIWVTGLDKPYLSCVACTTKIDPATGKTSDLGGPPEMYSLFAPDKLSLYYGKDSGGEANVTWVVALNGKQVSKFDGLRVGSMSDVGISPDGMQVVGTNYAGQGSTAGIIVYRAKDNRTFDVKTNVIGVGWGPLGWRVHPSTDIQQ